MVRPAGPVWTITPPTGPMIRVNWVGRGTDDRSIIADSARVVRYNYDSLTSTGTLLVEWSTGEGGIVGYPQPGARFLVNGRPLNGTGAGYLDSSPYTLNATLPAGYLTSTGGEQTALLPHYSAVFFSLVSRSLESTRHGRSG